MRFRYLIETHLWGNKPTGVTQILQHHRLTDDFFFTNVKVQKGFVFLTLSWQPLGPLLKVKLLVGYMRVSMCRVGTADLRRINCPKIATKYTWSQHWDCIKLRKQPNDNRQNNTTHFGHSADLKEFPEHGCTSDKRFVTPTSINYWRLVKELEYQRLSYLQETHYVKSH